MCLYELLKRANSCRVSPWTADTVDEILIDAMYMKAFDDDTIPDAETLLLTYLPDRVHWPTMTADPAKHTYIIHHFSGAPRGAFQQPIYNKCKVRWLRVVARPLQAVHNVFLSETLSCALR